MTISLRCDFTGKEEEKNPSGSILTKPSNPLGTERLEDITLSKDGKYPKH
jgi:hypothetical protein